MGGGGGRIDWPKRTSPDELLRRATSEEQRGSYETELNVYLQDLLVDFNNRNVDQIKTHLDTISNALSKDIEGTVNLVYGGSVKKHTYVDGLSDVDTLAIISETSLVDASPRSVLAYFARRLQERLPDTEIKIGNLAVTVTFSDGHKIQVLPAISTKTGIRISSADGSWSNIVRPEVFARKLTSVNQSNSSRVVPVIKLYKAINEQLPKDVRLSGYHIESLAINAFRNYKGKLNYKDMLLHLTEYASRAVIGPIKDSTGQSIHADDYLGDAGSLRRQKASAALKRNAARMKLADSEASMERWRELMGG